MREKWSTYLEAAFDNGHYGRINKHDTERGSFEFFMIFMWTDSHDCEQQFIWSPIKRVVMKVFVLIDAYS